MSMVLDPDLTVHRYTELLRHVAALASPGNGTNPELRLAAISAALAGGGDPDDPAALVTAALAYSAQPATVTLERFTSGLLRYDSKSHPVTRPLTGCESLDLHACPGEPCIERFGQLAVQDGATVADVALVMLPLRLPRGARSALARTSIPFGKLIPDLERRPVYARRLDGADGHAIAAEAVMWWQGKPVALAAEKIRLGWVMHLTRSRIATV